MGWGLNSFECSLSSWTQLNTFQITIHFIQALFIGVKWWHVHLYAGKHPFPSNLGHSNFLTHCWVLTLINYKLNKWNLLSYSPFTQYRNIVNSSQEGRSWTSMIFQGKLSLEQHPIPKIPQRETPTGCSTPITHHPTLAWRELCVNNPVQPGRRSVHTHTHPSLQGVQDCNLIELFKGAHSCETQYTSLDQSARLSVAIEKLSLRHTLQQATIGF